MVMRRAESMAIAGVLALVLVSIPLSAAAQGGDQRDKAAEETREALDAYRDVLADEIRRLREWLDDAVARATDSETKQRLEAAREAAEKRLDRLADEARKTWEDVRARMDAVVDDLEREFREAPSKS